MKSGIRYKKWGKYERLKEIPGYTIKILTIKPGKNISYQRHFLRKEIWILLKGTGIFYSFGQKTKMEKNDIWVIPIGCPHMIKNFSREDLVILELWVGESTEKDIERIKGG